MIQVELTKIIIDEKRQDQIIVLKEKDGDRQFPIVIGFVEASSIKIKLSGMIPPRPMTHDLVLLLIEGFGARLEMLVIDDMIDNTFHAKLHLMDLSEKKIIVDCRPSDGISVAVRAGCPIFVKDEVISKAAVIKAN